MKNFIEIGQALSMKDAIIIDVRTGDDDKTGKDYYDQGHLPGAFFMDVDEDLSSKPTETSGRHPLPKKEDFKAKLESFGSNNDSTFIIYDHGDNFSAGRLWFLLKYFSLGNAFIINGGFKSIASEGIELSTEQPLAQKGSLELEERPELLASFDEVKEFSANNNTDKMLIDSRSRERYLGLIEPLYSKAGHIPGAVSHFFEDNYYEDGKIKSIEELKSSFEKVKGKDLIVSCGSGVTACANLVVLDELGIEARLYPGSVSQWIDMGEEVEKVD